jgi:hypothetical protein
MKYKIIKQNKNKIELEEIKNDWTKQHIPEKNFEWGECSEEEMNWNEAKKWCKERGGRLPTIVELMEAYHGKVEGFNENYYWSSTEYSSTYAWYLYFGYGNVYSSNKSSAYYVRCVRGY